jgi:hypothetical protein
MCNFLNSFITGFFFSQIIHRICFLKCTWQEIMPADEMEHSRTPEKEMSTKKTIDLARVEEAGYYGSDSGLGSVVPYLTP